MCYNRFKGDQTMKLKLILVGVAFNLVCCGSNGRTSTLPTPTPKASPTPIVACAQGTPGCGPVIRHPSKSRGVLIPLPSSSTMVSQIKKEAATFQYMPPEK